MPTTPTTYDSFETGDVLVERDAKNNTVTLSSTEGHFGMTMSANDFDSIVANYAVPPGLPKPESQRLAEEAAAKAAAEPLSAAERTRLEKAEKDGSITPADQVRLDADRAIEKHPMSAAERARLEKAAKDGTISPADKVRLDAAHKGR